MFKFLLLSLLVFNFSAFSKTKKHKITFVSTQTSDYCGGAAPTEEILKEASTPSPVVGKTFYIIRGKINKANRPTIKKIITDVNGNANFLLAPGTYSIIDEEQFKKFEALKNDSEHIWDNNCREAKWKKPLLTFKVTKSRSLKLKIHNKCFYNPDCGTYSGPIPS